MNCCLLFHGQKYKKKVKRSDFCFFVSLFAHLHKKCASTRTLASYDVLAARKQRQQFGRHRTADEGEDADGRNDNPYWEQRIGHVAAYQPLGNMVEEENVHQIHSKSEFG